MRTFTYNESKTTDVTVEAMREVVEEALAAGPTPKFIRVGCGLYDWVRAKYPRRETLESMQACNIHGLAIRRDATLHPWACAPEYVKP